MHAQDETTTVNVLQQSLDLQTPALPAEFCERMFCQDVNDFFTNWLSENVPEPVYKLAHLIGFFQLYLKELYAHAGKVPGDLNEAAPEYLREGLQLLASMDYRF